VKTTVTPKGVTQGHWKCMTPFDTSYRITSCSRVIVTLALVCTTFEYSWNYRVLGVPWWKPIRCCWNYSSLQRDRQTDGRTVMGKPIRPTVIRRADAWKKYFGRRTMHIS